jgi:hypothetical protein
MPLLWASPAGDLDVGLPPNNYLKFSPAFSWGIGSRYWKMVKDENPLCRHHSIHWLTLSLKITAAMRAPKNIPRAMVNFFISNHFPIHWF